MSRWVFGAGRRGTGKTHVWLSRASTSIAVHEAEAGLTAVATFTSDGSIGLLAEFTGQAVASIDDADAILELGGEATLQAVATFDADAQLGQVREAEALLQGVAHMGFDPELVGRSVSWFRSGHGMFFPGENPRQVRGANETEGGRIPVGDR
jgi:hypothetical protein